MAMESAIDTSYCTSNRLLARFYVGDGHSSEDGSVSYLNMEASRRFLVANLCSLLSGAI
jgi:hypothetical protein